jgi:hypothetical protein
MLLMWNPHSPQVFILTSPFSALFLLSGIWCNALVSRNFLFCTESVLGEGIENSHKTYLGHITFKKCWWKMYCSIVLFRILVFSLWLNYQCKYLGTCNLICDWISALKVVIPRCYGGVPQIHSYFQQK